MSPSNWKIRSRERNGRSRPQARRRTSRPAFPGGWWASSCIGACRRRVGNERGQRDQAAPGPATRIASGTPNNATWLQGGIENGCGRDRNGRDEREPVACGNRERQRRRRGAAPRSAPRRRRQRAGAASAARMRSRVKPRSPANKAAPAPAGASRRPSAMNSILADRASRRRRLLSASPATKPAATITSPGEVIACAKPARRLCRQRRWRSLRQARRLSRPRRSPETRAAAAPG